MSTSTLMVPIAVTTPSVRVPVPVRVVPPHLVYFDLVSFLQTDAFKYIVSYDPNSPNKCTICATVGAVCLDNTSARLSYANLWALMNTSKDCRLYVKKALDETNRCNLWSEWLNGPCHTIGMIAKKHHAIERVNKTREGANLPHNGDVYLCLSEAKRLEDMYPGNTDGTTTRTKVNPMVRATSGSPGSWYAYHAHREYVYVRDQTEPKVMRMKWAPLGKTICRSKEAIDKAIARRLAEYAVATQEYKIAEELYFLIGDRDPHSTPGSILQAIVTFLQRETFVNDHLPEAKKMIDQRIAKVYEYNKGKPISARITY